VPVIQTFIPRSAMSCPWRVNCWYCIVPSSAYTGSVPPLHFSWEETPVGDSFTPLAPPMACSRTTPRSMICITSRSTSILSEDFSDTLFSSLMRPSLWTNTLRSPVRSVLSLESTLCRIQEVDPRTLLCNRRARI